MLISNSDNALCNIWRGQKGVVTLWKQIIGMETTLSTPVKLTQNAINEVKRLMTEPGFDASQYLRVGVKGGGCSGMTYVLGFDKQEEGDEMFEIDGISVLMNKAHGIYLFNMEVDYQDGLNARGFTFKNPNASSTCGCGTSFAV